MPVETLARKGEEARRIDPRVARTRAAMRNALATEIRTTGDLSRVTATGLAGASGLTRRTFYTHFRDVGDLVSQMEDEAIAELTTYVENVASARLIEVVGIVSALEPIPAVVDLLNYVKENGEFYTALLGPGGDPAFAEKIKHLVDAVVTPRALTGIDAQAAGAFFDYYLTYVISAEVGVLTRWLVEGMRESTEVMARIMTSLMFVRPGDLYGFPISLDVPAYALQLTQMEEAQNA